MNPVAIISKKKRGLKLSSQELSFLIGSYLKGETTDYQMSAFLMAVYFQGLDQEETAILTGLMRDSGERLSFKELVVDKHSTGGVGDKISLILVPILSACGVKVPMISGRGLGHTGGTLDKLESIPGFKVFLEKKAIEKQVRQHNMAIVGQTPNLCPADRKLYALRDVTSTVDSIPLICASIMSKKLAEGIGGLVMDVKFGSGAFMKDLKSAEKLAKNLKFIGEHNDVKTTCLLTNMNEPLGRFLGNALEIKECVEILENKTYEVKGRDLYENVRELTLIQAAHAIVLSKKTKEFKKALSMAKKALESGKALKEFKKLCELQGGSLLENYPKCNFTKEIKAKKSGYLSSFEVEQIGLAVVSLGGGRREKDDVIDYSVGIEMRSKLGMKVKKGDVLAIIYGNELHRTQEAFLMLEKSISVGKKPSSFRLVVKTI